MSDLRVYNTLSRTLEPLIPAEPGRLRMYVCGMTVYDYCHIGHARTMVAFDMVYRWLVERGLHVDYVRNHTDVDDKIIARAQQTGEDPLALSARFIEALEADLSGLGLAAPTHEPKVSEHIGPIIDLIQRIIDAGCAYVLDGDVFFSVESAPRYGQLSGKKLDDLRAGERVDIDSRKRHPGDFALWKSAKEGEPAWDSPWGMGRPGWHIECSAMSMAYLGERFDIHGGGIDLVFPHHENEIAQSECGTGKRPFARYWMHAGHLTLEHAKMSKSLGNIVRIRDVLAEVPGETLRLLYASSHYRSPLPYSSERLVEALAALDRIYTAKETLTWMAAQPEADQDPAATAERLGGAGQELYRLASGFAHRFREAMDEDFNTARAVAALQELTRVVNRFANDKKARRKGAALARPALDAFALAGRVLGVGGMDPETWFREVRERRLRAIGRTEAEIQARVDARWKARQARDWARADALRDELAELGVVLMDGPDGTTWRMRVT